MKTDRGLKVRIEIESQPEVLAGRSSWWYHKGSYINPDLALTHLTLWFLWLEDNFDTPSAWAKLQSFLRAEVVQTTLVRTVSGITISQPHRVGDLYLVPYVLGQDQAAFKSIVELPRLAVDQTDADRISKNLLKPIIQRMELAANLICAVPGHTALARWNFTERSPNSPYFPFLTPGRSYPIPEVHSTLFPEAFGEEEVRRLAALFDGFERRSASEQKWLKAVLNRIQRSKIQMTAASKVLDLAIAAEMLLLKGTSDREQLSLTFKLRGAWLLGNNHDERLAVYERLGHFYGFRCKLAHGGYELLSIVVF